MTPPICSLRWKPESGQPLRNFNGVQNGKVCKNHNDLKFSQYFTHLWKVCLWGMDPMQWYALSPILIKFQLQSLMSCQFQIEKACLNLEHRYKLKQKLSQYKYNSNEHGFHRLEKYGMWTHMNQLFPIIPGCILSIVGCWVWSLIDWWTILLLAFLVLLHIIIGSDRSSCCKKTQNTLQREYSPTEFIYLLLKKSRVFYLCRLRCRCFQFF